MLQHFPFRLEKLFIVDLPSQLRWVLATLRHMLHPDTKQKIHLVSINDPALPLQPHLLQTPQEQALIAEVSHIKIGSSRLHCPPVRFAKPSIWSPDKRTLFATKNGQS